jgi:SAM-dependent methyltransferase
MASHPRESSFDDLTTLLRPLMSGENDYTNTTQLHHRLHLLTSWFGSLSSASTSLSRATILDIGCGQGDTTVPLAHFANHVIGLDPAPLDYGSPFTLGQSQQKISASALVGSKIQWVQRDPIEYLQNHPPGDVYPEFVVLAHSIFYFESEEYFNRLLLALKTFASKRTGEKATKLLIAEWGMRISNPAAEAHVLAAKAQATNPLTDGNVRTVVLPERSKEMAKGAGWFMEREAWIESPELEDGNWEVELAGIMANEEKTIEKGDEFLGMERAVGELGDGKVGCMDVWTGVFGL